ncbi:tetratricopeptide repeat protein [Streptomyces krungchingensis]|uniref:tetratricopeptide repeat protein n=1 Tax=Streptomyces krungchingensis TaxID=1565034 RepID=UPI003CF9EFCB
MRLFRSRAKRAPETPVSRAMALYRAGRYAEAVTEARAVARSLPLADTYAPLALSITANATGAQGRHADALAIYDEVLPAVGKTFGADHWQTLKLRSDRAQTLASLGRYAECAAECAAVAQIASRGTGELQNVARAASNGLVFALSAQERHPEAEARAREALGAHPEPDRLTLSLRLNLARSLNGQARHEEALAEAERALELRRSLPAAESRQETGAIELAVATALLGLRRGTEARLQAADAHDACLASFGPDHRRTVEAQALLDRIDGA